MKKLLLLILILFTFSFSTKAEKPGSAQQLLYSQIENPNQIEFHINIYSPTGAFAQILDGATPTGFGINYIRKTKTKWSVGAEIGVAMYYSEEYDLKTPTGYVQVYEEDCFWHIRGVARYSLIETSAIKTYSEFRLGFNNFFSDVSSTVDEDVGTTVSHGVSLVAGVGLGMEIGLGSLTSSGGYIADKTFITVRSAYNFGSPTYYRSARVPSGQTNDFEKFRYHSEISYFDVNFGIGWRF